RAELRIVGRRDDRRPAAPAGRCGGALGRGAAAVGAAAGARAVVAARAAAGGDDYRKGGDRDRCQGVSSHQVVSFGFVGWEEVGPACTPVGSGWMKVRGPALTSTALTSETSRAPPRTCSLPSLL